MMESKNQKTIENSNGMIQEKFYSQPNQDKNNEIDLLELLINIKSQWRVILCFTLTGILLSTAYVFNIPKVYKKTVTISLPSTTTVKVINKNGVIKYSQESLFKEFYNEIRSPENFKNYIFEFQYLQKLYPEQVNEILVQNNMEILFSRFNKNTVTEILEPILKAKEVYRDPTSFSFTLKHTNEKLLIEIINGYIIYTNQSLLSSFKFEQENQKELELSIQYTKISLLKEHTKKSRELLIEKIEISNQKALNEFKQKKDLLIKKGAADRATRIAITKEAFDMAKALNIIHPTNLDHFNVTERAVDNHRTSIILNEKQTLPLYLMGTKYLSTLITSLKSRTSDLPFLKEINQIDFDMNQLLNDQNLKSLKERKSDDSFIIELPSLLNTIAILKSKSIDFMGVKTYKIDKAALLTNKAFNSKRVVIILITTVFSLFIGVFFGLISLRFKERLEQ